MEFVMAAERDRIPEMSRRQLLAATASGMGLAVAPNALLAAATEPSARETLPPLAADAAPPAGWSALAPRDEIRPAFAYDPRGGPEGRGAFVIQADARPGLSGCWRRTLPVESGKTYRFSALYRAVNVPVPRRSVVAKLFWHNAAGSLCPCSEPAVVGNGGRAMTEMDYPSALPLRADGWTEISSIYRAPDAA